MIRPEFKNNFHVEILEPDTVFLVSETSYHVFNGRVITNLAPLLNGRHPISTIVGRLTGKVSPPEIFRTLKLLEAQGLIVEHDSTIAPENAAFWHALAGNTSLLNPDNVHQKAVSIISAGTADAVPLANALQALNVPIKASGDLAVVVTDDYLQEELAAINQQALATGLPWMLAKLVGYILWLGPIFKPGETGCWDCMAERIRSNRQVESFILQGTGNSKSLNTSRAALPATVQIGANLAATEIAKWLVQGHNEQFEGQLLTFDTLSAEAQTHILVRRPQCPVCGDPDYLAGLQKPKPIQLTSNKKKFTGDGGHRILFPEETFTRYQHHISPITGVVSMLTRSKGDVGGLAYSYIAGHNFAVTLNDISMLRQNLRGRSGGKGMTEIQAKVSAIGEAIERYSGVYRANEEIAIHASYEAVRSEALHLQDCLLFSKAQYETRDVWNPKQTTKYHLVPRPLDETVEIDWTSVWSLTDAAFKYLPTSYCYYGHPDLYRWGFCGSDANGCASGNTIEEAILQGFMELVERDSVAIWWYNRLKRPQVDPETFGIDPYYNRLRNYYNQLHRTLWVLDITTDLNIPTFAAISGRTDREIEDIVVGFGAHLDPKIAMLRALTELNQFLPAVRHSKPDGTTQYATEEPEALKWFETGTMANQPYLVPGENVAIRTLADFTPQYNDDIKDDVLKCVDIAHKAGLEIWVLDQTRPDIGMPVCRVIVPGLRHFWRRLGPGRLYDIPVKLGWLDKPLAEEELNPFSMFF